MDEEIISFQRNYAWELVPLPLVSGSIHQNLMQMGL